MGHRKSGYVRMESGAVLLGQRMGPTHPNQARAYVPPPTLTPAQRQQRERDRLADLRRQRRESLLNSGSRSIRELSQAGVKERLDALPGSNFTENSLPRSVPIKTLRRSRRISMCLLGQQARA